jgi:molecular chaperone DnaK
MLKDNADKISGDSKSKIESAVAEAKEAIKGSDATAVKAASDKLNEAWQAVSAELYKAASEKRGAQAGPQGQGAPGAEPGPGKEDEGVIDAEVVDEKKS